MKREVRANVEELERLEKSLDEDVQAARELLRHLEGRLTLCQYLISEYSKQ